MVKEYSIGQVVQGYQESVQEKCYLPNDIYIRILIHRYQKVCQKRLFILVKKVFLYRFSSRYKSSGYKKYFNFLYRLQKTFYAQNMYKTFIFYTRNFENKCKKTSFIPIIIKIGIQNLTFYLCWCQNKHKKSHFLYQLVLEHV